MTDKEEIYNFHITGSTSPEGDFKIHQEIKIDGKSIKTALFLFSVKTFLDAQIKDFVKIDEAHNEELKNKCIQ